MSDNTRLGRQSALDQQRTQRRKALAKGRLDHAFSLKLSGDNDAALIALADAIRTDPELVTDSGALGLAQTLTGLPRDQAIAHLVERSKEEIVESNRPKFTITPEALDIALEIGILLVVFLALSAILNVGLIKAANAIISRATLSNSVSNQLRDTLAQLKPADLLLGTAKSGLLWLVSTLLGIFGIYLVGSLFGGVGTVARFTRRLVRAYTIIFGIFIVGLLVTLYAISIFDSNRSTAAVLMTVGAAIIEITALVSTLLVARVAARTHEIGYFKGLAAVFLGNMVVGVLIVLTGLLSG